MTDQATTENLRDAIGASFDAVQEADAQFAAETETPPAASETPAEGYESPSESSSTTEAEKQDREYNRDEKGKFADEKSAKVAEKKGITPGPKGGSPKERVDPIERAPQAWKPEAREFWNQIPEAARREIARTEQSIQQTLRETVEDRRLASAVKETIRPFEHFIKAEGSNPIQAIDNLLTTAARLRTGNINEVAGMFVQMANQFGTARFGNEFIRALDGALAGNAPQQNVDPRYAEMEQRLAQMERREQMQTSYAEQQRNTAAERDVVEFMNNAEFGLDLREEMADQMEIAAQRGQQLTLQDAYDRACWANPEIRGILTERQSRERAQAQNQVAQKARSAAVSVGGSPAFNANHETPNSIRDAIEFAMRK